MRDYFRGVTSPLHPKKIVKEVRSGVCLWSDGAAAAAGTAAAKELAGLPVGLQSDDRTLLPALCAQPAPSSSGCRGGGLSAQLCWEADPFQPPIDGRLCAAHACPGAAPHRRL